MHIIAIPKGSRRSERPVDALKIHRARAEMPVQVHGTRSSTLSLVQDYEYTLALEMENTPFVAQRCIRSIADLDHIHILPPAFRAALSEHSSKSLPVKRN